MDRAPEAEREKLRQGKNHEFLANASPIPSLPQSALHRTPSSNLPKPAFASITALRALENKRDTIHAKSTGQHPALGLSLGLARALQSAAFFRSLPTISAGNSNRKRQFTSVMEKRGRRYVAVVEKFQA